jgi:hypothetical protein
MIVFGTPETRNGAAIGAGFGRFFRLPDPAC